MSLSSWDMVGVGLAISTSDLFLLFPIVFVHPATRSCLLSGEVSDLVCVSSVKGVLAGMNGLNFRAFMGRRNDELPLVGREVGK